MEPDFRLAESGDFFRRRLIVFRFASGRYNDDTPHPITADALDEKRLRFQRNGNDKLRFHVRRAATT